MTITLRYFKPAEFWREDKYENPFNWYEQMDPRLLFAMDLLRWRWSDYLDKDAPIMISPHGQAIGRQLGEANRSDHNVGYWGTVRGIDLMPVGFSTTEHANALRQMVPDCGIDALGIYPQWVPQPGIHVGVRPHLKPGKPALWGAVRVERRQVYTTWAHAMGVLDGDIA